MCVTFYEVGKSKKGMLIRALKMWYMFADYNNMKRTKINFVLLLRRNDPPGCTKNSAFLVQQRHYWLFKLEFVSCFSSAII
jgi:hypothetical protein